MKQCSILATIAAYWISPLGAATVVFTQNSKPLGFVEQSTAFESATNVSTIVPPLHRDGFRFTHWELGTLRQEDATGRAQTSFTFTILEDTTATAQYLPDYEDVDTDGIPDWFEATFYRNLANDSASDTDGDGITLIDEYRRDIHPQLVNEVRDGGVSRASSELFTIRPEGFFRYTESSLPIGILNRALVVERGTQVDSTIAPVESQGYTFGFLSINGVRYADGTGRGMNSVSMTIENDTEVVAHYFPTGDDTDSDGVPDWFEWLHYGSLDNDGESDTDGDGLGLRVEYDRDLHPGIVNEVRDGGISRVTSNVIVYDLGGFRHFTVVSDPLGFVEEETAVVENGTLVMTPSLHGEKEGYYFTHWEVDGVRQVDALGIPLGQVSLSINKRTTAVARYVPARDDTDDDRVPDWFEILYFGDLSQGTYSDLDSDGISLVEEYDRNLIPLLVNRVRDGGVSRASGQLVTINFQPFERLRFALVDGVLTEVFAEDPFTGSGWDFGSHASPALGDWDGDGDLDFLVATTGGLSVYENAGTLSYFDLSDRTAAFDSIGTLIAGVPTPRISLGDFDGDGNEDLAVGGATGMLQLFRSTGSFGVGQGTAPNIEVDTGSISALPAFGDVDGDGHVDLLALLGDGTVRLYPHSGDATAPYDSALFEISLLPEVLPHASGLTTATDLNGDGMLDVVVAGAEGRLWEFHSLAGGGFFPKSKVWAGASFTNSPAPTARDIDADGDVDVLLGTAEGMVMALRDPRLGRPTGLTASRGPGSVILDWNPNIQSRIKGYYVYRAAGLDEPYERLNYPPILQTQYLDRGVSPNADFFYNITSVSELFLPGNTVPRVVESGPSDTVRTGGAGVACLVSRPARAKPGRDMKIRIAIANSVDLSGVMEIRLAYDPAILTPLTQIETFEPTVLQSGLTKNLELSDNGGTADGEIVITSTGGDLRGGRGTLFTILFRVNEGTAAGTSSNLEFSSATLFDTAGQPLAADCSTAGSLVISDAYSDGDVNGDGAVDDGDGDMLWDRVLGRGHEPTDDELAAGDLNGDGELDNEDLVLLNRILKGLPITP